MKLVFNKIKQVTLDILKKISLKEFYEHYARHNIPQNNFFTPPNDNIYRLLKLISHSVDDCTIVDIGTFKNNNAIALSSNSNNTVMMYDLDENVYSGKEIEDKLQHITSNIIFQNVNIISEENIKIYNNFFKNILPDAKVISIDIRYCDNIVMLDNKIVKFIESLENTFKGILILHHLEHKMNNYNMELYYLFYGSKKNKTSFFNLESRRLTGIILYE